MILFANGIRLYCLQMVYDDIACKWYTMILIANGIRWYCLQMVYDDIVCKFAVCTFNLRNRVMSFYLLFISEAATKGVL